ncbi:MAG: hypothetical protein WBG42_04290 [Cryomorphaceae bacterium]
MENIKKTIVAAMILFMASCVEVETKTIESTEKDTPTIQDQEIVEKNNALQLRSEISDYRRSIENSKTELEKGTLSLTQARAEISTNWQKLDYYTTNDKVVRIKTYPSAENGAKTEEFYFKDDRLVFAIAENEGAINDTVPEKETAEGFYYSNGELIVDESFEITEATQEEKDEMDLATKLQDEGKEYLSLVYQSQE